eukprot:4736897-Prymnesium_polylepis.2
MVASSRGAEVREDSDAKVDQEVVVVGVHHAQSAEQRAIANLPRDARHLRRASSDVASCAVIVSRSSPREQQQQRGEQQHEHAGGSQQPQSWYTAEPLWRLAHRDSVSYSRRRTAMLRGGQPPRVRRRAACSRASRRRASSSVRLLNFGHVPRPLAPPFGSEPLRGARGSDARAAERA